MEQGFKIEVSRIEVEHWLYYEELESDLENIRDYVRLVRTAYPEYRVRALNHTTGEVVS